MSNKKRTSQQEKKRLRRRPAGHASFERVHADPDSGLSAKQVQARIDAGAVNRKMEGLTPSVSQIVIKNTLTLFNLINIALAVVIILVGHPENTLFLGIVICNTGMGIFQEIRAKRTLDKLSVLAQSRSAVIREGRSTMIAQDEIVLDDIVVLAAGDQVCADGVVANSSGLEIDESLLTGETNRIRKEPGDTVFSGSYVTAGQAVVRTTAVGKDNYANTLTTQVTQKKKSKSRLLQILNAIIKVLTVVIIPLGVLLFYANYSRGESIQSAVLGAAAAMTGMIPGGLVLLTGVTMTVGAMNLAKRKALVQSLSSIETLARVDVLCLDKTGTITDGALVFEKLLPREGAEEGRAERAIAALMYTLGDQNATALCLRDTFRTGPGWQATKAVPFSSDRKWSGASFDGMGTYVLGAPGMILQNDPTALPLVDAQASQGYRVLCLAHSDTPLDGEQLPPDLRWESLILLTDSIRKDAAATFRFFADEGVTLKVISGDNPRTVSAVAMKAGLDNADKAVDMRIVREEDDYDSLVEENTVFGHVTPQQKQKLIRSLHKNGHTACMTGDGVNDILAMREADCSVAMAGGSSAARSVCDFVLLSPNFGAMKGVLREGRRVINNIEQVASLYLVNTVYSIILTLIYTFLPMPYPYAPLQMTPINAFTVGIPSFFLALRPNYSRPSGKLMSNIFEHALPAALTIVFNTLYLQLAGYLFELSATELSTMVVFMVGVVGFFLLFRIARPYTRGIKIMLGALLAGFILLFTFFGSFFTLGSLFSRNAFFYLPLSYFSFHIHGFLGRVSHRGLDMYQDYRKRKKAEEEAEL